MSVTSANMKSVEFLLIRREGRGQIGGGIEIQPGRNLDGGLGNDKIGCGNGNRVRPDAKRPARL